MSGTDKNGLKLLRSFCWEPREPSSKEEVFLCYASLV